jgi:predicted dienelactone hydrolase
MKVRKSSLLLWRKLTNRLSSSWRKIIAVLFLAFVANTIDSLPATAAEHIKFYYSVFGFSISVRDLANFAETGEITPNLAYYLDRLDVDRQQQLRKLLKSRYKIDDMVVYRFLRTYAGEKLLGKFGELIQIPGGRNGFYGLRGAILTAAREPDGINIISILRAFSTDIELNLSQTMAVVGQFSQLKQDTENYMKSFQESSDRTMQLQSKIDFDRLPDLRQAGSINYSKTTVTFVDPKRDRTIVTDLYLPEVNNNNKIPVIIISNGVGAKRTRFRGVAEHLSSHGFAVIIPDHSGSNDRRQQDFFVGLYKENFDFQDFVDRPLDITFILDKLEELNPIQYQNRLDLKRVGIFGYSFGGTTALALAGAEISFAQLQEDCGDKLNPINISILYQCRALALPKQINNLEDKRITSAFLFVPFGKSLFGKTGIEKVKIPIFWQATDEDLITPLILEQTPAFEWLKGTKYLAISRGLPHALITLRSSNNKEESIEKVSAIMNNYLNAMSLAFFQTYNVNNEDYRLYLNPIYTRHITEQSYIFSLVISH